MVSLTDLFLKLWCRDRMAQTENNIAVGRWMRLIGKDIGFVRVVLTLRSLKSSSHCEGSEQDSHRANMPRRAEGKRSRRRRRSKRRSKRGKNNFKIYENRTGLTTFFLSVCPWKIDRGNVLELNGCFLSLFCRNSYGEEYWCSK